MKLQLKINSAKIFIIIYVLIGLANVAVVFLLYQFINNSVYRSIFVDQSFIESQSIKAGNDLNVGKIKNVADQIDAKEKRTAQNIKNVF
jgi:hypothetical protein